MSIRRVRKEALAYRPELNEHISVTAGYVLLWNSQGSFQFQMSSCRRGRRSRGARKERKKNQKTRITRLCDLCQQWLRVVAYLGFGPTSPE
jgi:hypothetical protein